MRAAQLRSSVNSLARADLYDVDDSVRREIAARHTLRSTGRSLAIYWSLYD